MKVNTIEKTYKYNNYKDMVNKREFKQKKQNIKKDHITFAEVLDNVRKNTCI